MRSKRVYVVECRFLSIAKGGREGIPRNVRDSGDGTGDRGTGLDVEAFNLGKVPGRRPIIGNKLSHDGERTIGVQSHTGTVESGVPHPIGVEIASIDIALRNKLMVS